MGEEPELKIERKWWFDEQGNFSEEELNIFKDGCPIGIERGANPIEVKEEFIQTKIPPQIAKFFFFDGEEIRKIADKDPSLSVREGLNSLLGFAILEQLVEDLKKTKDEIKRETGKSATKTDLLEAETELCRKQEEITQIKEELVDKEREKNKLDDQFEIVKTQISSLTGGYESSEHNKIQEQLEELEKEEGQLRSDVGKFVSDLLCVAMPRGVLKKAKEQLTGELKKKAWEEKKNSLSPQKNKITKGLFGENSPQPEPPLLPNQKDFLKRRLEEEWNDMFNPPPEGMANNVIHTYLNEYDTKVVLDKITDIENKTQQLLLTRIIKKDEVRKQIDELRGIQRRMTTGPEFQELLERRDRLSSERSKIESEIETLQRRIEPLENEISSLKQKYTKLENELNISKHGHNLIDTCRIISDTIEDYMKELRNKRIDGLSKKMTEMYKKLAHKKDVIDTIAIHPTTYKVAIKGSDGYILPEGSAGENELFALSMIWALAVISRRDLPFIIDTPLARFDTKHRENIVKSYFPDASKQIVILSQDTEIDEKWYNTIRPYVAKSFLLDFNSKKRTSTILENQYFNFNQS